MTDLDAVSGAFILAISRVRRRLRQLPVADGLPAPEMTALVRLDREGPATSSALAKAEQMSPQSMQVTVAALEERGLVERSTDPGDRRRVVLSLTEAGRDAVLHKRAMRTEQVAAAMSRLTAEEVEALRAATPVLERLADVL